jgi:hypothetical protein
MSWSARIEPQPGGLRIRFSEPLTHLDMDPPTARRLACLILEMAASVKDRAERHLKVVRP